MRVKKGTFGEITSHLLQKRKQSSRFSKLSKSLVESSRSNKRLDLLWKIGSIFTVSQESSHQQKKDFSLSSPYNVELNSYFSLLIVVISFVMVMESKSTFSDVHKAQNKRLPSIKARDATQLSFSCYHKIFNRSKKFSLFEVRSSLLSLTLLRN